MKFSRIETDFESIRLSYYTHYSQESILWCLIFRAAFNKGLVSLPQQGPRESRSFSEADIRQYRISSNNG